MQPRLSSTQYTWHPLPDSKTVSWVGTGEAQARHPGAPRQEDSGLLLGFREQWAKDTGDWGAHMSNLAGKQLRAAPNPGEGDTLLLLPSSSQSGA